jgi:hypothetical protein
MYKANFHGCKNWKLSINWKSEKDKVRKNMSQVRNCLGIGLVKRAVEDELSPFGCVLRLMIKGFQKSYYHK